MCCASVFSSVHIGPNLSLYRDLYLHQASLPAYCALNPFFAEMHLCEQLCSPSCSDKTSKSDDMAGSSNLSYRIILKQLSGSFELVYCDYNIALPVNSKVSYFPRQ